MGKSTNGWQFFLADQALRRSLRDVRRDYIEINAVEVDEDETDDEGDDDAS